VIACIEDPVVIEKILTHLNEKAAFRRNSQLISISRALTRRLPAWLIPCSRVLSPLL
jgi:hypothetical protein